METCLSRILSGFERFARYTAIVLLVYGFELLLFAALLSNHHAVVLNFALRSFFVVTSLFWLKKAVFPDSKNFLTIYLVLSALNPLLSSGLLHVAISVGFQNMLLYKVINDVLVATGLYLVLVWLTRSKHKN